MNAGGFVSHVGRVNGNLNLSRSLGDLKYKQVEGVPREDQMITAEPDITVTDLLPDDEFFILGCDGIWDCLTSQQAVSVNKHYLIGSLYARSQCSVSSSYRLILLYLITLQCDFVRRKLIEGYTPMQCVDAVLQFCLSADPRGTSGIGGDNMTFLVVLLNPSFQRPLSAGSASSGGVGSAMSASSVSTFASSTTSASVSTSNSAFSSVSSDRAASANMSVDNASASSANVLKREVRFMLGEPPF
jgi:serine/threonine protein phosphatase PrpC